LEKGNKEFNQFFHTEGGEKREKGGSHLYLIRGERKRRSLSFGREEGVGSCVEGLLKALGCVKGEKEKGGGKKEKREVYFI